MLINVFDVSKTIIDENLYVGIGLDQAMHS